jgi:hypothetical protein
MFDGAKFSCLGDLVPGISASLTFTLDGSYVNCHLFSNWELTTTSILVGQVQSKTITRHIRQVSALRLFIKELKLIFRVHYFYQIRHILNYFSM